MQARALGRADWAEDPQLKDNTGRYARREYLLSETGKIIGSNTVAHWISVLEAAGVPCSPVQNIGQVLAHPQTQALGMIDQIPGEKMQLVGLPFSLDGERLASPRYAPRVGEHNAMHGAPAAPRAEPTSK